MIPVSETYATEQQRRLDGDTTQKHVVCVTGLGYVGLPLAVEFDRAGHDVIGFDVDPGRIEELEAGTDPTGDLGDDAIADCDVQFTADEGTIGRADFVLVAVPTPVDEFKNPNLEFVEGAGELIGRHLAEDAIVVLESTVYPGATRTVFAPAIEATSGMIAGEDFSVGYSPERLVPGDDEHGLRDVVKIVSGQNEDVLADVADLYESIVDAGVHRAPTIEVAEAAKCIENVQRDVNIALVNELAVACHSLGVDTHEVLEAAGTKWNFHGYRPGLVGGHCIPVDPFYIISESKRNGFSPELIERGREVNEYVPKFVAELTIRGLNACGKVLKDSTVFLLGLSYKPGVGDVRSSIVDSTIEKLQAYGVTVVGHDPCADDETIREEFEITVHEDLSFEGIDGILLATPHEEYLELDFGAVAREMEPDPLLVDVEGAVDRERLEDLTIEYRRL